MPFAQYRLLNYALALALFAWLAAYPQHFTQQVTAFNQWFSYQADAVVIWGVSLLMVGLLLLAFMPFGRLTLGAPDDAPRFSLFSWLAMLFAGGMGSGLVFWGMAEPLIHASEGAKLFAQNGDNTQAIGLSLSFWHWGFQAWAIYAASGLAIAWFSLRKGRRMTPAAVLRSFLPERFHPFAMLANTVALLSVLFGLVATLYMGSAHLMKGLPHLLDHEIIAPISEAVMQSLLLICIGLCVCASVSSRLSRGIRLLSIFNIALSGIFLLLIALLITQPANAAWIWLEALQHYAQNSLALPLKTLTEAPHSPQRQWLQQWSVPYFMWWVAWAPFMGMFLAQISRGRTVRSFILGVILVPSLFSLLWFGVMGTAAFEANQLQGGVVATLAKQSPAIVSYALLEYSTFAPYLSVLIWGLMTCFLVTSIDSGAYVLAMFSNPQDADAPPRWARLFWAILLIGSALFLLAIEQSIGSIFAIASIGAVPYLLALAAKLIALTRVICRPSLQN